jgi:DNA-3-methyladenine glycosylase I
MDERKEADMEAPEQITAKTADDYLEVITKAVFQAGISWRVIAAKWDGFREAFHGFDAEKVASFTPEDVDRLAEDTRIVRNRSKIQATVDNAETLLTLEEEFGSVKKYLRSHADFDSTVKDLRARFKWLGDSGAYYFLHVVKEPVPPHDEWMASHGGAMRSRSGSGTKKAKP